MRLATFAIDSLTQRSVPGENVRQEFVDAIDIMIQDYARSQKREVLSREELEEYFHNAFDPLINIALIGLGSKLRKNDLPSFGSLQARAYSIRDLEEDWEIGLINIPKEVLNKSGLHGDSAACEVRESAVVQSYFYNQLLIAQEEIWETQEALDCCGEWLTQTVLQKSLNTADSIIRYYTST